MFEPLRFCEGPIFLFFDDYGGYGYDILVSLTLLSLYFHEKWLKKKSKPATVFLDEIRIDRIEIEYRLNRI